MKIFKDKKGVGPVFLAALLAGISFILMRFLFGLSALVLIAKWGNIIAIGTVIVGAIWLIKLLKK